jgi:hypothetical protein
LHLGKFQTRTSEDPAKCQDDLMVVMVARE